MQIKKSLNFYFRSLLLTIVMTAFAFSTAAGELQVDIITVGNGEPADNGMQISVHYEGRLSDGTVFDSSRQRGLPFSFILGNGQVIKGWESGILGMKVGEKRVLTIPPELAYGVRGAGSAIPPNATLVFDIEMVEMTWPPKLEAGSNDDLETALQNETLVIDIRRPDEWQATGVIEGAELVTAFTKTGQLHPEFQGKFSSLVTSLDTPIMLYCRTGNRTTNLGNALISQLGFTNISHLKAGIVGWQKDDRPVVSYQPK